jgi:2-desacetyl-2-hydroxyethyl bacteriochlorophyllide A dehydrogenase
MPDNRAVHYLGGRSVSIVDGEAPRPTAGHVRIAVAYTGICGTDLHIFHGDMDHRVRPPGVIGHEMSGTIEDIGPDVSGWAVGDPVTVMPLDWCGQCPACASGHNHICHRLNFLGIDSPGCLQSLWTVPASTLVALPAGLRLDHAALVEPTAVAVHDVRRGNIQAGEKTVVVGGGPVGLLIALVAQSAGADVLVLEPNPQRRAVAAGIGLTAHDPTDEQTTEFLDNWTCGAGADVAVEVSGAEAGVTTATEVLATRGRLVLVAIHTAPRPMDLFRLFWRELTVIGARVYERADFEEAVRLLSSGVIPAEALITRTVPLDRVADAFTALEAGTAVKILVNCAHHVAP